jgi:hypothetical protein
MGEASLFGGTPPRAERHSPVVQRPSLIAGVVREIERPSRLVFAIQALDKLDYAIADDMRRAPST